MGKFKLSLYEQETIISFNRAERNATVYTHEPALKKRLKQLAEEFEEIQLEKEDKDWGSAEYTIPKELATIRKPRSKRILSEEEKELLTNRLLAGKRKA